MPRVSVIMPAHQSAATIVASIESIRAQTFPDWELVVADDASSDDTLAVVEAVGDVRVVTCRSERNLGPAGARNLALGHATGELVALLDADDTWHPEYLERQVGVFDREQARTPGVGVVACDAHVLVDGSVEPHTYYDRLPAVGTLDLDRLLRGNAIFISALVPRAVGDELGWFSTEVFGTEDHDLWLRILESGRRAVLNREPLVVYRVHAGSVSSNLVRMAANYQLTYRRALARGRLSPRQRRIARNELRYHRALELVARAWTATGPLPSRLARLAPALPLLALVVVSHPRRWAHWLRMLRSLR